jgi:hypothetical protein
MRPRHQDRLRVRYEANAALLGLPLTDYLALPRADRKARVRATRKAIR